MCVCDARHQSHQSHKTINSCIIIASESVCALTIPGEWPSNHQQLAKLKWYRLDYLFFLLLMQWQAQKSTGKWHRTSIGRLPVLCLMREYRFDWERNANDIFFCISLCLSVSLSVSLSLARPLTFSTYVFLIECNIKCVIVLSIFFLFFIQQIKIARECSWLLNIVTCCYYYRYHSDCCRCCCCCITRSARLRDFIPFISCDCY